MDKIRIAIIGYGKMGREIEKLARQSGHEVLLTIDNEQDWHEKQQQLKDADVAIEFTAPPLAPENITRCLQAGVPVVCGTTGWYEHLPEVSATCHEKGQALFYAPNFSIGVNLFFELNAYLAKLMAKLPTYKINMSETHHTQKLDAPSGTAIKLADDILKYRKDLHGWALAPEEAKQDEFPILANRVEGVTGTHEVTYLSDTDRIDIKHTAHNRQGFTEGALLAATWIIGKKGVFTMKDLLNL